MELTRSKESAISLNKQISVLNQNILELEGERDSLKKENGEMTKKFAQLKGSLDAPGDDQGQNIEDSGEFYKRPESSKIRVRIDDSS